VPIPGAVAPPGAGKVPYGTPYEFAIVTNNFLVTWWSPQISEADGELTAEIVEAAWQALVVEQGWTPPVSSDRYLIWVTLDLDLSSTGLTYELFTSDYPDGYPIVSINPIWTDYGAFYRNLVAHEFAHALQFAVRNWDGSQGESWYWEASAEWGAERAAPKVDGHLTSVPYYSDAPWYRFDSMEDYHQYGMFVLNAWLEEHLMGSDGLRDVWLASSERPGLPWDVILEDATGTDASAIWGGFVGAMGNNLLSESAKYADVLTDGPARDGQEGAVAYLGADYFVALEDGMIAVTSPGGDAVQVAGPTEWGQRIQVGAGDTIGVIGLTDPGPASYRREGSEPTGETGLDTGAPPETDTGATSGTTGGGSSSGGASGASGGTGGATSPFEDGERGGCGCGGAPVGGLLWLGVLGVGGRRRSSAG